MTCFCLNFLLCHHEKSELCLKEHILLEIIGKEGLILSAYCLNIFKETDYTNKYLQNNISPLSPVKLRIVKMLGKYFASCFKIENLTVSNGEILYRT